MHWGEGRDISERPLGDLPNHNTLGQLTNLSPTAYFWEISINHLGS